GLFNSSGGNRLATDAAPNGTGYTGYAMFGNFGSSWGRSTGLDHRKRNNISNSDLLGTSGDYSSLGSGGTTTGARAFSDNDPYTLTFSYTRDTETTMRL